MLTKVTNFYQETNLFLDNDIGYKTKKIQKHTIQKLDLIIISQKSLHQTKNINLRVEIKIELAGHD